MSGSTLRIHDVDIELFDGGTGEPLLFLHSAQGFRPDHPFVGLFAAQRRVIAPSHPGFGKSNLPDWIDSVDDIAYLYLELLDRLNVRRIDVVGCSIGGWIAAEIATKAPERINKLVLVGPVGVKVGPPDKLDIPDIFVLSAEQNMRLLYHDPARFAPEPAKMSDEEIAIMVRNRETLALLVWEPYMHNPKLKHRLHRVTAPSLLLRGASDGMISQAYLEAYARMLPNARVDVVAAAGHSPQIEAPAAFAAAVLKFLGER